MTDHATLAAALVAALADLTVVEKGRKASIPTKAGGNYSYGYADLADIVTRTRPRLAEHGIVALTPVAEHGDGLACTVILLHSSGDRLDLGPFPFPHGVDARSTGSMVTYHRRYALVAALGMAIGDEDDDGAAAMAARYLEPPVPGFRSSLLASIDALTAGEKAAVKAWMAEHDLPPVKRMTAEQADRLADYIVHGIPAVPDKED